MQFPGIRPTGTLAGGGFVREGLLRRRYRRIDKETKFPNSPEVHHAHASYARANLA